jgi:hypothetical protein
MTLPSEPHEKEALLRLARPCPYPEWMLLDLPNGMWAAFWKQGFDTANCSSVAEGRYREGCAYRSKDKDRVLRFMSKNRLS